MKKIRLALLTSTALIVGAALVQHTHAPLIREAQAQMAEFGGDRMIPLGFCGYTVSSTTASTNILNGSIGCTTGVFGTIGAGITGTGPSIIPALAKYVQICVTGTAYYRDDGIAPTVGGTGGMPMGVSSAPNCQFYAGNISNFEMISNGTATVSVLLYGQP